MSQIEAREEKPISQSLRFMIKNCASNLFEFTKCWDELKVNGLEQGFTEAELQGFVIEELKAQGFTGKQVSNKIFYMKNREEIIEKVKDNQAKKKLESTEISVPRQGGEAFEKAVQERIRELSFNDNPDIFQMNKNDENYFDNITPTDALTLIKNSFSEEELKSRDIMLEIAWRRK